MISEAEYAATRKAAVAMLEHRGNSHEDAEDAVQDAALSMLTTRSPWDGHSTFKTWFCRVAINARGQEARRPTPRNLRDHLQIESWIAIDRRNAESDLIRKEQIAQLSAAIDHLSPKQCQAVVLFYFLGMKSKDSAALLGINVATMKSRLDRSREAIRAKICSSRPH